MGAGTAQGGACLLISGKVRKNMEFVVFAHFDVPDSSQRLGRCRQHYYHPGESDIWIMGEALTVSCEPAICASSRVMPEYS